MSRFPVDLAKFRKVKSDDKTTTFQHHEGHTINVAHNKISSKLRSQLAGIPMAKQKVQKFAEGGGAFEPDPNLTIDEAQQKLQHADAPPPSSAPQGLMDLYGGGVKDALLGTPQETIAQSKGLSFPDNQETEVPKDQVVTQQAAIAPTDGGLRGPANTNQASVSDSTGLMSSTQGQIQGLKEVGAGQQAEQKALAQQGLENVAEEKSYQKNVQENLNTFNEANAPLVKARQDLMSDIASGHVNPQRYIQNMSTGDKVFTAIGLILGGMGSGLTGGPNLAYNYLQNQIDRDIDSQKSDLGKKENLLSHNLQQTHDLREAYNLTKLQTLDVLNSHLRMTADQTADPMAKAKILQVIGQTDQQTAQLQHQMAIQKMQLGGIGATGPDPAKLIPLLVPKEHQAKAFSEVEAAENTRKMSGSILQSFEDAAKKNTVLRTGAGFLRTPAEVYSLHQAMQPTFKDLEGTVRQAAMDNTFKNITPMPGDTGGTIDVKRQALKDYLQSKLSAPTARGYGIDLRKFGTTAPMSGAPNAVTGNFGFKPRVANGR